MIPQGTLAVEKKPTKKGLVSKAGVEDARDVPRFSTGIENIDVLLGGGLAEGSVMQFVGSAGAGKSTLLAQLAGNTWKQSLYITTEESKGRLSRRLRRVAGENWDKVDIVSTVDDKLGMTDIRKQIIRKHPAKIMIVDSLQGMRKEGSAFQEGNRREKHTQYVVRDIAMDLISEANDRGITIILAGHMTKTDNLAGLQEIVHMVDIVAWLRRDPKGKKGSPHRFMETSKNRDGDASYIAHFLMGATGMVPFYPEEDEEKKKKLNGGAPYGQAAPKRPDHQRPDTPDWLRSERIAGADDRDLDEIFPGIE